MPSNFREMAGTSAQTSLKEVPHTVVATGSWSRCQIPSPALEIWLETGLADSQRRQLMTDRLSGQHPCTVPSVRKEKETVTFPGGTCLQQLHPTLQYTNQ